MFDFENFEDFFDKLKANHKEKIKFGALTLYKTKLYREVYDFLAKGGFFYSGNLIKFQDIQDELYLHSLAYNRFVDNYREIKETQESSGDTLQLYFYRQNTGLRGAAKDKNDTFLSLMKLI